MNTSIFNDQDFLEQLFKLAQQENAPKPLTQVELNKLAIDVINNLKGQLSALKADKNPNFSDVRSLDSLKVWAKTNNAAAQGNLLIQDDKFNIPVLEKFLTDLRDKSQSNPLFSESVASLIEESNSKLGTKIAIYTPKEEAKTTEVDKKEDGKEQKTTNNQPILNYKIDQKEVDKTPNTNQSAIPNNQAPNNTSVIKDISLLNGITIDFDDISGKAELIYNYVIKQDARIAPMLKQIVNKIGNIKSVFNMLSTKTDGLNSLAVPPTLDVLSLTKAIVASFNAGVKETGAYTYEELSKIAQSFANLMEQIKQFYYVIQRIPVFEKLAEISKQIEWADDYSRNFTGAARQLLARYQSGVKI